MNLEISNHTIDLTELIVAYQRVKNRVELNTPKSVEIRKRHLPFNKLQNK
ncbi:hypothetical protein ACVXZZ_15335 [Staphylococcus aureus]